MTILVLLARVVTWKSELLNTQEGPRLWADG
jgi:hypothetical protein